MHYEKNMINCQWLDLWLVFISALVSLAIFLIRGISVD